MTESQPAASASNAHKEFLALLLANRDGIFAFIVVMVRDRDRAEDIFQDVSLVMWEKFETFQKGTSFGAWARQIAVFKIQNERRRLARAPVLLEPETLQNVTQAFDETEQMGPDEEWKKALHHCLDKLSPAARRLLEMRYFKKLRHDEMAAQLGRTLAGVNSALCKVRVSLEGCMKGFLVRSGNDVRIG
ncbi:MAG TPA: sigma-70 family RNA polymerase sigma factor [Planctomycetota bacterium]|nr:sigma-70 family RNA polymerase sigma factor [Planctomycetota bacterium]